MAPTTSVGTGGVRGDDLNGRDRPRRLGHVDLADHLGAGDVRLQDRRDRRRGQDPAAAPTRSPARVEGRPKSPVTLASPAIIRFPRAWPSRSPEGKRYSNAGPTTSLRRHGNQAPAKVAGGGDAGDLAQPAARAPVVGHRDDRGDPAGVAADRLMVEARPCPPPRDDDVGPGGGVAWSGRGGAGGGMALARRPGRSGGGGGPEACRRRRAAGPGLRRAAPGPARRRAPVAAEAVARPEGLSPGDLRSPAQIGRPARARSSSDVPVVDGWLEPS